MKIWSARALPALVVFLSGCLDLSVPTAPARGAATGIIDTGGRIPAAGNDVRLVNADTAGRLLTATEGDGGFIFGDLAPGTYQLQADLPGFAPLREGPFRVLGGEPTMLGTFAPTWLAQTPAEATLSGLVIVNGGAGGTDGGTMASDAGSRPSDATGATVAFLLEAAGNTKVNEVTVNAFGAFTARLPPGRYTLRATHPYFVAATVTGVMLAEGQQRDLTTQPLVMELNPAELVGTLRLEVDKEVMTRPAGNVTITSDTGVSAVSDAQGNYRLPGLAGGTRTITFRLPGYHDATAAHVLSFVAAETKMMPTLTLLLDRGDVTGTVEMADGTPIQQVTVDLPGIPYSATVAPSTAPPSRGRFVIPQVPLGTYNVRASRPNYAAAQSSAVTVVANAPVEVGTLRLTRIQGDFVIDDTDVTNTAGFVRQRDVTLVLSNVVNAAQYRVAEGSAAALMAATYQPFTSPRIAYQLTAGDGIKTVFLQIKDASNNESASLESSVVLDSVAPASPAIAIASGQGFTRIANPVPVTLTADDPGSGLAYIRLSASSMVDLNGELQAPRTGYARDVSFTRPVSTDGVQQIFAQFIDNAGNVSAVTQASVVIDTVAPTGTITIARGSRATLDGHTNSVLVNLNITAGGVEPNGGFLQVKLANEAALLGSAVLQPVTSQVAWFVDPVGEGTKTVHFVFVDAAGNQSGAGSATIRYDVTAPAVTATLTSAARSNSPDVTLSFSVTESGPLSPTEGLTLSENALFSGATPVPYPMSNSATFTVSASDGPKTINARVRDAAGNDGIASVSMELDQTAPTGLGLTLSGALADGTPSTTLTSSSVVTVNLTHTGATGVSLGGASVTSCPSSGYQPITGNSISGFTLPGSGTPRTVTACFTDAAGNTAGPVSASIAVDGTTPTGCSLVITGRRADGTPSALARTALKDVTYTLTGCTEPPTELYLTESSATCAATASLNWDPFDSALTNTVTLSALDGAKTVRGCVRDAARNTGSITAAMITLDTTPPSGVSVVIDSAAAYVNASQKAARGNQNQVSVAGTAVGATDWAIEEAATPSAFVDFASQNPRTFVFSTGDGVKTIRALFRDDVGNTTAVETTDSIEFDTVPPTATSLSISGALADGTSSETVTTSTSVLATVVQTGGTGVLFGDASLSACPPTGYSSYSGGTVATTLGGSGTTRTVRACLSDAAGNTAGPVSDSIDLDTSLPTGCTLVMSGKRADGSATALDKTAVRDVSFVLSGCAETPQDVFLVESVVACTNSAVLDWKTFVPGASVFALSAVDGLKTVRGCVRDRARNVASLTSDDMTLDTTPPTSTSVSIDTGAAFVNASQVAARGGANVGSVQATASGAFEWAIAEGGVPSTFVSIATNPRDFTFTAGDGVKTIRALFRDDLGNTSAVEVSDSIEFDTVAPSITSLSLSGTLADGTPSDVVSVTTNVQASVVQSGATQLLIGDGTLACSSGGYVPYAGGTTGIALPGVGATRLVRACVSDAAGNTAGPVSDSIDLDATTPTGCGLVLTGRRADGTATSGGTAGKTALQAVTATLSGCSEVPTELYLVEAAVSCSASAALGYDAFNGVSATFTLSALDGLKTVRGCVRDRARNTGSLAAAALTLDQTAPTNTSVSIDSGASFVNATQKAARGGSNVASIAGTATGASEWAIDETNAPSSFVDVATNPRNFTFSTGDGLKTIRALFRDDVGNTTAVEVTDAVEFDTSAPTLTGLTLTGALANGTTSTTLTSTLSVQATVVQTGATQLFIGDQAGSCPATPYLAFAGAAVSHTLTGSGSPRGARVCVADAAGNTAGPLTATIGFDGTAPSGCTVVLTGARADGTPTSGGQVDLTAQRDVIVTLSGCSEVPSASTQIFLTEGAVTCSASAALDWRSYVSGFTFTLSSLDGNKTVRGCVRDAALNVGSLATDDITLDTTPPTGGSVVIDTGAAFVNAVQFAARGNANVASVQGSAAGAFDWGIAEGSQPTSFVAIATNPRNFTFSAGDGTKTIFAIFRDALGNTTASVVIRDDITFDTAPPSTTGATVTAVGPTANDYTNTETVTVNVTNAPADAVQARVAQAASTADCAANDMTLATPQSVVSSYLFTLTPAEGLKRVCVQWLDAAGNPSAMNASSENYADTVTLDRTAPTTPQIITSDQAVSLADSAVFNVTISSASSDTNFSRYEKLGGTASTWTTVTPTGLSFAFNVRNPLPAAEAGVRNELRLRAVDLAGNTSGESSVFITADTNAPDALPAIIDEWIDNGNGKSTLYWLPNLTSTDLKGYRIFYGSTAGSLIGSFATEGVSPINTLSPTQTNFTLSGIPNGTKTYIAVAPVDLAGNVGPTSAVKQLQPGPVSPNAVATLTLSALSGSASPVRAVSLGRWLYVASQIGACPDVLGTSTCSTGLHIVDMQNLETPIQRGTINTTPGIPAQVGPAIEFPNDEGVAHNGVPPLDMLIDGNLLFIASGRFIHILNLNVPSAPTSLADIDVSAINANYRVHSLGLVGDKLIIGGRLANVTTTAMYGVLNLAPLYVDGNATRPTTADLSHFTMALSSPTYGVVTRDRLVQLSNGGQQLVNLADGIDPEPASSTLWSSADVVTGGASLLTIFSRPVASGNLIYGASSVQGFRVVDLSPAWSGVTVPSSNIITSTAYVADGQTEVRGAFAFLPDRNLDGLRVLSVGDVTDIHEVGVHSFAASSPTIAHVFGNYSVLVSFSGSSPRLRFLELSTPRALSVQATAVGVGGDLTVRPGFVLGGTGNVFDINSGDAPIRLTTTSDGLCTTRSAWFDNVEIGANGNNLVVRDLELWVDRNPATTPTAVAPDRYTVALPAGTRVSGVAAWGNYLVAAEVRNTGAVGTDGVWLEVFNVRRVRDQIASTVLQAADSVGALRVFATQTGLSDMDLDVTMTDGRAALSIDSVSFATGTNLYIVDLRSLFDDSTATALNASAIQGSLASLPRVRRTVLQGGFAYLATANGLLIYDVKEAVDESAGTVLPPTPASFGLFAGLGFDSLVVSGSMVFLAPATSGGVYSVDVATPLVPTVQGFYGLSPASASCTPAGDVQRRRRNGLDLAGPRLYVTAAGNLWVFNLE